MKKVVVTIIFNLVFITVFGQIFPKNNPELLLNKIVKPKVIPESLRNYSYKFFFIEFNKKKNDFTKDENRNRIFSTGESYSTVSDYSKLVGKEFKVINIYELTQKYSFDPKKYALELENQEIGKVYYKYDSVLNELELAGDIEYPEGFFCKDITIKKDKFDNVETYRTPIAGGIMFTKNTTSTGKSSIYLSIQQGGGSSLNVGGKGFSMLFEDGTKFTKSDENVDVNVGRGGGYIYSSFIKLNDDEVKLLTEKSITDTRVYLYDGSITKEHSFLIKEYLKCLIK